MAFNAGRVEVHLGAQLERRDFELYEKELRKVKEQTAKKEQFRAQLGGDFNPRAFNAYQRELKRTERSMDENVKAQGRLRTSFGALYGRGGALFAAAGGIAGLTLGLRSVVKASGEAEVSQKKMAAQLKASGISYAEHAKEIDKVIQKTSQLSGLDDEDLQDAFTNIVRVTGDVNKSLRLTGLAADFARAKHLDVAKAGEIVGKVAGGNIGILSRYGITIDKGASSTEALGKLQDKFRGQAEAYGKTQQGAFDRVSVAFENLRETIGVKLGPTITRVANRLAVFITQMSDGTGAGGRFVDKLEQIWKVTKRVVTVFGEFVTFAYRNFATFVRRVREDIDMMIGWFTGLEDAMLAISRAGEKLPIVGGRFKGLSDTIERSRDRLNKFRDEVRPTGHEFDSLGDDINKLNRRLSNDRGTKQAGRNFKSLRNNIASNINDAVADTDHGMGRIRLSLSRALRDIGDTTGLKKLGGTAGDIAAGLNRTAQGRAVGGWIGAPGMVGGDIVPAMLAPGEAVLNRHQQAIIEGLLGDGFLDRLFAQVDRPHYFASGGRAGLQPAVASLASRINSMFGLVTTSTTGGQHAPGSYHYQGLAADLSGPAGAMFKAAEWIKSSGVYRSLLEGIHNPNLAVKNGQLFPGAGPFGGVWGNHANHIHIALRALGAVIAGAGGTGAPQIAAPQVGGTGALRAIVQSALTGTTGIANAGLGRLAASMGGGDITSGGLSSAGGSYNKARLASLWRRAGGDPGVANLMAAIALAESGGNPRAHNRSGASGLWQILGLPFPGDPYNPLTNARMAVAKYGSQGLGAWEAYTNGSYRQYMARGGRAGRSKRKKIPKPTAAGKARDYIRPLAALNTDRIGEYDAIISDVDDLNTKYGQQERIYDFDTEELIRDDGTVDEAAVKERGNELLGLISYRALIVRKLKSAVTIARRVIKSYNTIINRLRRSLKHAGRKSRASIRETIGTYTERRDEWRGKLHDLEIDTLPSAKLDLRALTRERADVLGTQAEPQDTSADTGTDTGSDTGPDTAPPSPVDIAAAALADLSTFNQSRADMLGSYARNFITSFQAGSPGAVFSGTPDELAQAAGVRYLGAGSAGGGLGGATIINNYNQLPDNTQTWSQQMRFQLEAA